MSASPFETASKTSNADMSSPDAWTSMSRAPSVASVIFPASDSEDDPSPGNPLGQLVTLCRRLEFRAKAGAGKAVEAAAVVAARADAVRKPLRFICGMPLLLFV